MTKFRIPLFILLNLFASLAWAATEITFSHGELAFTLPDSWDPMGILAKRSPARTPSDPYSSRWKRAAIKDSLGNPVSPGMNVTMFNVAPDVNVALMSSSLMHRRGWPFKELLTSEKDGLSLPNSMGYLTEFSPREGLLMKVFVVHAINNGTFVEVNLSATEEIFPQVEPEFRAVLRSLRLSQ